MLCYVQRPITVSLVWVMAHSTAIRTHASVNIPTPGPVASSKV